MSMPAGSARRFEKRIIHAKRRCRAELSDNNWTSAGFCKTFSKLTQDLMVDNIERVDASKITVDEFFEKYESRGVPIMLTGLTVTWPATSKWHVSKLLKKYRNQRFKCGEDDYGNSVKLKMKYFVEYMKETTDDVPLYIFDSTFGERHKTKRLLEDYEVPAFFADDLFRYACDERRPPYRWFVLGPPRSGTGLHVDPLGTSAWNALIHGYKKWCFFHPETPKNILKPAKEEGGIHPDEAVTWFTTVYKRIGSSSWSRKWESIEAVQHPGEIIFVPSGWWHVVLNLTETVGVTHNFCSRANMRLVYTKTLKGRPKFCRHWLNCLRKARPDILSIISDIADIPRSSSSDSSSSTCTSDTESEDSSRSHEECFTTTCSSEMNTNAVSLEKRKNDGIDEDVCAAKIRHGPG